MPPRRARPIVPSDYMSVGGDQGQHDGSSNLTPAGSHQSGLYGHHDELSNSPQAAESQSGQPVAGNRRSARNILAQTRGTSHVPTPSSTNPYFSEGYTGSRETSYSTSPSGLNQNQFGGHHYLGASPPFGYNSWPASGDYAQPSPRDDNDDDDDGEDGDEDYVESDDELAEGDYPEADPMARKRRGQPDWQSNYSKKIARVPGGAGENRGPKGCVQTSTSRGLEYWNPDQQTWIPAVYHHQIRQELIKSAKTSRSDVYTHPRARGKHPLDITAFLERQRDWDLERDRGWTGVEFLYQFRQVNFEKRTDEVLWLYYDGRIVLDLDNRPVKDYKDIPLTLSSQVEGGLMAAIRRLDDRIQWQDFWARIPERCGKGGRLRIAALRERSNRFRLQNCIISWTKRKGTAELTAYVERLMSRDALESNSTRELSKLSSEQIEEAKKANKGKFDANAGGWLKNQKNNAEEGVQVPRSAQKQVANKPAQSRSRNTKLPQLAPKSGLNIDQSILSASEQSEDTHASKRRKTWDPAPSGVQASQSLSLGASQGYIPGNTMLYSGSADHGFHPFASSSGPYGTVSTGSAFVAPNQNWPYVDDCAGSSSGTRARNPNPTVNSMSSRTPLPQQVDYRHIEPRTQEEIEDIQAALQMTLVDYSIHIGSECLRPPMSEGKSYFQQLEEIEEIFRTQWIFGLGSTERVPDLTMCLEPWRNGFKDWANSGGGNAALAAAMADPGWQNFDGLYDMQ